MKVKINKSSQINKTKEQKWIDIEYDIAKASTSSGVNARFLFLGFMITINLAFYKGYYDLFSSAKSIWLLLLCLFVFLVNSLIYLIYIREHYMQEENFDQVKKIRYKLMRECGYRELKDAKWFKFHEEYKDPFKGVTYKIIMFIISFLIVLSYAALFMSISLFSWSWNIYMGGLILIILMVAICIFSFWLLGVFLPKHLKVMCGRGD